MVAPTRDLALPFGCISAGALRSLAATMDRLDDWQESFTHARQVDRPCLRRLEATADGIRAHVSTGPAVGGSWFVLELAPNGWRIATTVEPE